MDRNRWQETRRLFHAALEREPAARAAFLAEACGGDAALRAEVDSLLGSHEQEGTFLPDPLVRLGRPDPTDSLAGDRLGPYALERPLGRGGMGTVYLGRRADGAYRGRVAIKVLHDGVTSDALVRRFRQERQILADLEHPHIARLLDGGTAPDGRPFLVMELVEGDPIDRYCEARRLPLEERLELFRKVCSAVHFAHQNLVIHRDLKPGNILVTADGEPKLLDFGIAKLVEPYAAVQATATGHGFAAMTPEFASPEQMRGDTLTTASDVYSLGALLYQLLSGQRPFSLAELPPREFVEAVCRRDPPLPSAIAPPRLRSLLRGDLDNVVLKALAKEPLGRYPSAEDFSQDLGRYLGGLPVHARESTLAYRAGKFLRRHRWLVSAAAAAVLTLATFTGILLVQRTRILEERAGSREVTRFLEGLFEISNPEQALGERVTARELLDRSVLDIRGRLGDQPELRASLLATMGRVYRKLGLYEQASPLLEEALAERRGLYGAAHREVAESLLDRADLEVSTGAFAAAEARFQEALSLLRSLGLTGGEAEVRALSGFSEALRLQGRSEPAEALQREALEVAQARPGDARDQVATGLGRLGNLLLEKGEYGPAAEAYGRALATRRQLYGESHPAVADLLNDLGILLQEQGELEAARESYEQALAIHGRVLEDEHRDLAPPLHNLAALLDQLGRFEEAEEACRRALEIRRRALGTDHPNVADSLNLLGLIRGHRGDLEGAERLLREAQRMWTELLGEDHPKLGAAHSNLGEVLRRKGDLEAAAAELETALGIYRRSLGADHPQVATTSSNLAFVHKSRGELARAHQAYREALEVLRRKLGPEHVHVATVSHNLAALLHEMGRLEEAEARYREALGIFAAVLGPRHANPGLVRKNLASVLLERGEVHEAARVLEEALRIFEAAGLPPSHRHAVVSRGLLGECRTAQGRFEEAEALLVEADALAREHHGEDPVVTAKAAERLRRLHAARGRRQPSQRAPCDAPSP